MHRFRSKVEPQPSEHIPELFDAELEHFAPSKHWTVSYTEPNDHRPAFHFVSHHSDFGDALFRVTSNDLLTSAERRVAVLGALGLTAGQTANTLSVAFDTAKTQRVRSFGRYFNGPKAPEDLKPTMQSLTHALFMSDAYEVLQPLPKLPDRLATDELRAILGRAVTGESNSKIAEKLGLSFAVVKRRLHAAYSGDPSISNASEAVTLMHLRPTDRHPRISNEKHT